MVQQPRRRVSKRPARRDGASQGPAQLSFWQCTMQLGAGSGLALRLDLEDVGRIAERITAWLEKWNSEQRALRAPGRRAGKRKTRRKGRVA